MIKTVENLREILAHELWEIGEAHNPKNAADAAIEAIGIPADLVISIMRLYSADPASITAVGRVVAERLRQIEGEGWTIEHDDRHADGDMALAGAAYAENSAGPRRVCPWPWPKKWWKPSTPERDRCKAMALLIAEDAKAIRAEATSAEIAQAQDRAEGGQS